MNEFAVIEAFFAQKAKPLQRQEVLTGIGDDAALVLPSQLLAQNDVFAICTDTSIENIHFPANTPADAIAHKALAVNLSDLAAMGAKPCWITLALNVPSVDEAWLAAFSTGLFDLCKRFQVQLIGGDTCRSPHLAVTIQAHGTLPANKALLRSGAKPGDKLYVSNTLGGAAYALAVIQERVAVAGHLSKASLDLLNKPQPQVDLGILLRDYASSCIDLSDGLLSDLNHICIASQCGAILDLSTIPLPKEIQPPFQQEQALEYALLGGDDYQLCFTIPANRQPAFERAITQQNFQVTCIGEMVAESGIRFVQDHTQNHSLRALLDKPGFQHFA